MGAVVELVSPDSGMTTIRSSRSSKASSVFLSDDSPVGDATAGGVTTGVLAKNQSPVVLSCLSPPVPPERKKHRHSRNKSDNFDLLSFDPPHGHVNSEGKGTTSCKSREGAKREESSSFSELEELNLVDFSGSSAVGRLERRTSSVDHRDQIQRNDTMDTMVPPTPVNSVVGSRPPSSCGVRFFPEDVVERINSLQHKDSMSSSLSETWDELDTQGASTSSDSTAWNMTMDTESPLNIMEELSGKELTEKRNEDESLHSRGRFQTLEPQLSLIIEPAEAYDTWNPDSIVKNQWNPVTVSCLQLTPPEEDETGKGRVGVIGVKEKTSRKKAMFNTLTPDTSKEEDEGTQGKRGDRQMELLDFWTYSAQKGFLKSDSGTTTSYPDSLDMWNMTIRDDSLSPLTTPDNISETYGSFCRMSPTAGADAIAESPLGFTDSGMAMWNTTIQEDSSSPLTTPEASDNGNVNYMASLEASVSPQASESKVVEGETVKEEDRDPHRGPHQTVHKVEPDYNVKIVIESVEDRTLDDGDDDTLRMQGPKGDLQQLASEHPQELSSTDLSIPIHTMVTSTSEYDNVGCSNWSLASSPETYASPVIDIIQLEERSSPFGAVTKPNRIDEEHHQYQRDGYLGKPVHTAGQQQESQVFWFERTSESGNLSRGSSVESKYDNKNGERSEEDADWSEQPSTHSPFVLVDISIISHDTSADHQSSPGTMDLTRVNTIQAACTGTGDPKHDGIGSPLLSRDFQIPISHQEDGSIPGLQNKPTSKSTADVSGIETEATYLHSGTWGEQETLRCSRDSLYPGSQDDLRSNSDGDSSGLEMEYIIVSGTVKEAERESSSRHKKVHRQSDETGNATEMFSRVTSVQQDQVQAVNSYQENTGSATSRQPMTEVISYNQPKVNSVQPLVEDGNYDGNPGSLSSSLSPSLRYPSDHFLKAREEVYVHSQISMEDSDEGGQSPSAPPPCPTSLGDIQTWKGQLTRKETPETTSEPQSPIFTHSSLSRTSSSGTPLSESGVSTDRGLGLPFSGDLMEEENVQAERERDINTTQDILTQWTSEPHSEMEGRQQLGSPQLLCFAGELNGGSLLPERDEFQQNTADDCNGQLVNSVLVQDKWPIKQQIIAQKSSQDTSPFHLR